MATKEARAWDCDTNTAIPQEKETEVFEEIADMKFPFEGIATVPPKKDKSHLVFFNEGTRYRVLADPSMTVLAVKELLFKGGITRANDKPNKPAKIESPSDIAVWYAGDWMEEDRTLASYGVPAGCQCLIAVRKDKVLSGKPDPDSAYWN